MSLTDACFATFSYSDAQVIYDNALSLSHIGANDKDKDNNHKFIGKERKAKSSHPLIAHPLHYHQDIALASTCFDNIKRMCLSQKGRADLTRFVQMFYDRVSSHKSQIHFGFKDKDDFYFYCCIAFGVLPTEYWCINICQQTSKRVDDERNSSHYRYEYQYNETKTLKVTKAFGKKFPDFKGLITHKTDYNGYQISLIHPATSRAKNKSNHASKASPLMKYVVHLLMVYGVGVEGVASD